MRLVKLILSPWGRIDRTRFWLALLLAAAIVVVPFMGLVAIIAARNARVFTQTTYLVIGTITIVVLCCASYVSTVACAKRFNDRGKSSWWVLVRFIPVLGAIWIVVELGFLRGTSGRNRYGSPPGVGRTDLGAVFDERPFVVVEERGRASNLVAVLVASAASIALIMVTCVLLFQQHSMP